MEALKQDLFTGFTFGTVSAVLTIEGEEAEKRPEMLANTFSYVSKGVYKTLIPRLAAVAERHSSPQGDTTIDEKLKIELLGFTITLDLKVQLTVELGSPDKEALRFLVVDWVGTEVAHDIVGRVTNRLMEETVDTYYREHPDHASPFGDSGLAQALSTVLGDRVKVLGLGAMGGDSTGGGGYYTFVAPAPSWKHANKAGVVTLIQVTAPARASLFFVLHSVCHFALRMRVRTDESQRTKAKVVH